MVGSDCKVLLEDAYPINPESWFQPFPPNMKANFIDFGSPEGYTKISPFGPYERAIDLYGDGSLYLVDSPGHLPGHLAAAARIAPNDCPEIADTIPLCQDSFISIFSSLS